MDAVRGLQRQLREALYCTPVLACPALEERAGNSIRVFGKLEFLQRTGTFKIRGALGALKNLSDRDRAAGIVAVSAGNHAIAAAYAAALTGVSAKVVMMRSANPARVAACRELGAELLFAEDAHGAFELGEEIQNSEGRYFLHPFEGPGVATGTGTLGLEICEQCADFDTVIVPVGGGGLIGGMSHVVKQLRPEVRVIGVEPLGADSMHRSFTASAPREVERVDTVADSLGAPYALPYSFELCRQNVDQLVLVSDDELRRAMGILFDLMNMAVEPACAASTAALLGPLRQDLRDRRVLLIFCGSNIDWHTYEGLVSFGEPLC